MGLCFRGCGCRCCLPSAVYAEMLSGVGVRHFINNLAPHVVLVVIKQTRLSGFRMLDQDRFNLRAYARIEKWVETPDGAYKGEIFDKVPQIFTFILNPHIIYAKHDVPPNIKRQLAPS